MLDLTSVTASDRMMWHRTLDVLTGTDNFGQGPSLSSRCRAGDSDTKHLPDHQWARILGVRHTFPAELLFEPGA